MYIYDLEKIKNVLLGVIKGIEQNKWTLNKAIEEDKKIGYTEDLDKIKESINSYLNYNPQLTIQDIKNQSMDGYGNIAIIYDGSVEITIESIIKVLYTHNNITLAPNLNLSINNCIVEIITQELKKNKYNTNIEICDDINKIYSNQNMFDIAIFVGDKYEYKKFKTRFYKDVVYNPYGYISVYADSSDFKNILVQLDKIAYINNFGIEYYNETNLEEVISKINEITFRNTVAIFTKDSKKATELIYKLKADKIFINKNPFEEYKFELNEEDLLMKKIIK